MNDGPRRSKNRYDALIELLQTAESLWEASRVFFARWDLSPSQFNVLNLLHGDSKGLTQVELSNRLIMHRSNVTGLVDRLEARGLLRRNDNPTDRRAFQVVLTPAGARLMREIHPHYREAAERVWGRLSVKDAAELVRQFQSVADNAGRIARETANEPVIA